MNWTNALILLAILVAFAIAMTFWSRGGNLGRDGEDANPPPHAIQQ